MGLSNKQAIILVYLVTLLAANPAKCSNSHTLAKLSDSKLASLTDLPVEELTGPLEAVEVEANVVKREAESCLCHQDKTTVCNCTAPSGVIESPTIDGYLEVSYYIEADASSMLSIYFTETDVALNNSLCTLTFGDQVYSMKRKLQPNNLVYIDAALPIKAKNYYPYCNFTFNYTVYPSDTVVENLIDISGVLVPPQDPNGDFYYQPNTRYLWILRPNVSVSKFNFTFNFLDLGVPSNVIHDTNKLNHTEGDFLLIGPGEELLSGSEVMFYGQRPAEKIRQVVTLGELSHVFFYSYGTSFNSTGFNISYIAEVVEETTTVPSTTANPLPPENLEIYTVTAINGIRNTTNIDETKRFFEVMISIMSNEYLKLKDDNYSSVSIYPNNVVIEDVRECRLHCEQDTCASFNFSIAAYYENDWIFTKRRLDDMLNTEEVLDNLGTVCEICGDPKRNMGMYVGVPVAIVVIACMVSMAFWFFGARDHQDDAKLKYEQEIADRMDDNRRRSSGDISILGVGGGSIASRGTLNSRRFTMPFPKAKRDDDAEEDGDAIDMSGYKEYDPDTGRIDPTSFGIHREFLSDKAAVKHYTNEAFVDDDDNETTVFRRPETNQPPETVAPGTDSEDSDGGGAVSFEPRKKKNTSATPVVASVEVHRPEHLSLKRPSTCSGDSETAL